MVGLGRMNTQMDDLQKNLDEERKTKDLNHRLSAMLELIIALIIVVAIAIVVGTWWHRRKVSRLSFRLDEDAQRISDLRTKIEQLEKSGKNSGQEMARLKEELPHGAHIGHAADWHTDVQSVAAAPVHRRGHGQRAAVSCRLFCPASPQALAGMAAEVQGSLDGAVCVPHHAG